MPTSSQELAKLPPGMSPVVAQKIHDNLGILADFYRQATVHSRAHSGDPVAKKQWEAMNAASEVSH